MKEVWLPPEGYITVAEAVDRIVFAREGRRADIERSTQLFGDEEVEVASHIPVNGPDRDAAVEAALNSIRRALIEGSVRAYTKSEIGKNGIPAPIERGHWAHELHGYIDLLAGRLRSPEWKEPIGLYRDDVLALIGPGQGLDNQLKQYEWDHSTAVLWVATRNVAALNELAAWKSTPGRDSHLMRVYQISDCLHESLKEMKGEDAIDRANKEIINAAIAGRISIRGQRNGYGEFELIDPTGLSDREFREGTDGGIILEPLDFLDRSRPHWHSPRFRSVEVLKEWPAVKRDAKGQDESVSSGVVDSKASGIEEYTRPSEAREWFFGEACGPKGDPTKWWPVDACEKGSLSREEIELMIKGQFPNLNRGYSDFARELRAEALDLGFPWKVAGSGRHKKVREK